MKKILIVTSLIILVSQSAISQTYNINTFVKKVKENNKDILIAMKDLEIAEEQETEASANAYPQLSAQADYKRNLKDIYMFADFSKFMPGSGNTKFKVNYKNEFGFNAVISQQIFNYTVFTAIKAAKQYEKLSNYVYDATLQGVINGSKKAFYQTLLMKEVWKVNKASEEHSLANYNDIKAKFDAGTASQFQLLQAEVRWKNSLTETTKSKRNLELALNSLKSLAGIPVENNITLEGNFEEYPTKPEQMEISQILMKRPDYNALIWEQKLRNTNIEVEKSGHFPMLYGTFIYNFSSISDEFKLDRQNNALIAGLTLKIPIFKGWSVSARVQKAKIEAIQAQLKIDKRRDEIYTQIKNISLKLDEAKERINSAKKTLETAKKAFQIAENSSQNGLATQLELKDAQIAYDQAQLNYFAGVYDYLEAYFDWELATGVIQNF